MAEFEKGAEFLYEVVPELRSKPIERVKQLWREWTNSQPPDVRLWLKDPLSKAQRRTLQFGFAADYYQTEMLIAFQVTQDEIHQKMLDQDPRNQRRMPILEAAQRDLPDGRVPADLKNALAEINKPILEALTEYDRIQQARADLGIPMIERTLPDGSVIFAQSEAEADALVARYSEKSAEPELPIPDGLDGGGTL